MKQKFIDAYMDVAERFAQLSSARRLHVGAIVVKDDRIISIGYITNLVWVLLCLLPMLHVWIVPNLYSKVVLAVFYIGTLIGILVASHFWKNPE